MRISQQIVQEFEDLAHYAIFASWIFGVQTLPLPSSFLDYGHSIFAFAIFILDTGVQAMPLLSSFLDYRRSDSAFVIFISYFRHSNFAFAFWISGIQTSSLPSSFFDFRRSNFTFVVFSFGFQPFVLRLCFLQF